MKPNKLTIATLCGGPSPERGISLNSARSVLDHLGDDTIEIIPIYFDYTKQPYKISQFQLYSNTPSDFDFKLVRTAKRLTTASLISLLRRVDIVFPVMHGAFGEDGTIQRFLETYDIPYIGSDSKACKRAFDKYIANEFIATQGFFTLPSIVLKIYHTDHKKLIDRFFKEHKIKRAVVKPASGGSSIGVFSVSTAQEALVKANLIFSKRMDTRVVVEPFCTGTEFTVIILQNRFGMPVAVIPTEIEADYTKHQIFDFRKKYLPTHQVHYHCPPRFDNNTIERIQVQAEQLFTALGMRDFGRFDGWVMPDGRIWFSDFNPISGMEQNSFLFQQSSRIGMSHRDMLMFIVRNACRRYNISFPKQSTTTHKTVSRKPVNVLFGGSTSERQVSLMSGTNAWLKLRKSKKYDPKPFLLDLKNNVWELPYTFTLNHTVEEIVELCTHAKNNETRLHFLVEKVILRLALKADERTEPFVLPKKMPLGTFMRKSPFVFIGLHGGIGEDGTLQRLLRKAHVPFNGSPADASELCMDKYQTGEKLKSLETHGIFIALKKAYKTAELYKQTPMALSRLWYAITQELRTKTVIIKPRSEGCSSGIVRLGTAADLKQYIGILKRKAHVIPQGIFKGQHGIIEMPLMTITDVIFEPFIKTDVVRVKKNKLQWKRKTGWIEVTVGVLETHGRIHALNPSLTVASGAVLSVEEKFQGGTGINITPPVGIAKPKALRKAKRAIERVAEKLGVRGYARIDAFLHVRRGDIIVIEANTLPALTPSTVLFHQALAEKPPITPQQLMEKIVENNGY